MHRTTRTPRPLVWGLLIAMLLPLGAAWARAQEQLPAPGVAEAQARHETLGIGQTRRIGMSTKLPIADLQNENPTVVRIDKVDKDPSTVFVTGVSRGTARLIFTDVNKNREEILVHSDDSEQRRLELLNLIRMIAPTAVVQVNIAPNNTVILTGYISDIETGQRIMEAARAVFGIRTGAGATATFANIFNGMTVGGVQQVQLEVVVAVVNRSRLRTMNFSWLYSDRHLAFNSILTTPTNFASNLSTSVVSALTGSTANVVGSLTGAPNLSFGYVGDTAQFQAYLQALNTDGLAKIMADSRITTLSGRPAFIVSGGETPILTSGGVGQSTVSYKQFGTVVNFLPIVLNGKIHLEVRPELSAINAANGITIAGVTPTVLPGFTTRSAQCAVQLEDGQTLAIGGLIQNTVNATIQRVPVLGDIPFLNVLFTNKSYNEIEEELLILVTPRLVDGISCTQIPKYLPGRETRSPDDFELFLEGIMEAPRGPRYVSAHPFEYKGAHMLSPNAGSIPCAATPGLLHGGYGNGCATCGTTGGCATGQCGVSGLSIPAPVAATAGPFVPMSASREVPAAYTPSAPVQTLPQTQAQPQPLPSPAPNAIPTGNLPAVRDLDVSPIPSAQVPVPMSPGVQR
jgi:pilus assembly protein CpaC